MKTRKEIIDFLIDRHGYSKSDFDDMTTEEIKECFSDELGLKNGSF